MKWKLKWKLKVKIFDKYYLRPGDQPTVADPLERKNVYIDKGVMQDGIYARRDIRNGELICYYSGVIFDATVNPIFHKNQTEQERFV